MIRNNYRPRVFPRVVVVALSVVGVLCAVRLVAAADTFEVVRVASGISQPVYVTAAPGDSSRLFIVEANSGLPNVMGVPQGPQIARIKILNLTGPNAGTVNSTPFLELSGITQIEDQGLFNLAFHPNYADNGIFYVSYATGAFGTGLGQGGNSFLYRYQVSAGDPNVANPASGVQVLQYVKPYYNHNGNWLGFNPMETAEEKYYLYHTTGDGGDNQDPGDRAQDPSLLYGKVLRFDVGVNGDADDFLGDPNKNYAIPPDNAGLAEPLIWDTGLRNPWRASFDRQTGDLYIGNVGSSNGGGYNNAADEVEVHLNEQAAGVNFGWSRKEGVNPGPNPAPPIVGDQNPIYQKNPGSMTGGYVYRGLAEELQGHYIFADFLTGGQISSLQHDGSAPATYDGTNIVGNAVVNRTAQFVPTNGHVINNISSFGEDALGNLYIVDMGNFGTPTASANKPGEIYKVVPKVQPTLTIDRDTGEMTWTNLSGSDVAVASYSISSAGGAINPNGIVPITGNYDNGGTFDDNDDWQITSATNTLFAENSTGDAGGLAASDGLVLGNTGAWVQSIYEDLKVNLILGDGNVVLGRVVFAGNDDAPFDRSDLNFNGALDPADWDVFKFNHQNVSGGLSIAESYGLGDLDGDGDNDFADFRIFQADYIAANGAGAFADLNVGIPEPGSLMLALAALSSLALARRRSPSAGGRADARV